MLRTWQNGSKVIKYIGFDATENDRAAGKGSTYSANPKLNLCPRKGLPSYKDRYDVRYPLIEAGITRSMCRDLIVKAGLPIPPKSACFFCPASKVQELKRLAIVDPAYYVLALAMEVVYRTGHHFRSDEYFTIKAKHKETGELVSKGYEAVNKDAARLMFRTEYDDLTRPFKYELSTIGAVGGLDFGKPWLKVAVELPHVYRDRLRDFMVKRNHAFEIDNRTLPILA